MVIAWLLIICVILLRFHPAFMNLTVIPKNTVVLVGDSTAFVCSSSGTAIVWSRKSSEEIGAPKHVYINGQIQSEYKKLGFRMSTDQERKLLIEDATIALAGSYECVDPHDEDRQSAKLIILENRPECIVSMDEFIGPNDCNLYSDEILLSCRVKYRGNKSPDLEWRKLGESAILNSNCTTENNSEVICNVTVQPDLDLNGSSFVCQTTERASQEQYNCTTEPINTLHSFNGEESQRITLTEGDKAVCTSNISFTCTYKWVWYEEVGDDLSRTIESTSNVLIAKKIGLHRCEAQCKLRNQTCRIFPQYIKVIPNIGNASALNNRLPEEKNNQWTPSVIGLLVLGVLPYFTFGCYLLTRKLGRKRTHARNRIPASEYQSQEGL